MSKIILKNESGFGLLIENDAGYISSDLNINFLNESFDISQLKENQPIYINCILQKYGVENKNGRIYPKEVLINQVNEYQKIIDMNSSTNEADHPETSTVSLHNISHLITKIWWGKGNEENVLFGQLKIIVSPGFIRYGVCSMIGDKIMVYLMNKIRLGISSRGVGTIKNINGKNIVQNDFELICFDLVSSPSTPGAFLFPEKNEMELGNFNEHSFSGNKLINENNKYDLILDKFIL